MIFPLQLATGKAITIPGLMTGNIATESATDAESVIEVMSRMRKLVDEFREVEMKKKLEESLDMRIYKY